MIQKIAFDVFLISWEVLCYRLFIGIFSRARRNIKPIVQFLVLLILIAIECIIAVFFSGFLIIKSLFITFTGTIAMSFLYKSKWKCILIYTVFYQGLGFLSDYVVILFCGKIFISGLDYYPVNALVLMLISVICRMVLLFVVLFVKRIAGSEGVDILTEMEWLRLLIFPICTIVSITAIAKRYDILNEWHHDDMLLYIAIGMAAMNINIFYLIDNILAREKKIREGQLYREKVKNETQWYYSISQNLDKQRKKAHEYKNHIECLAMLVKKKEYDKLEEYILKMDVEIAREMDIFDANHVVVNAILNTKYMEIREKGIVFVIKISDLSDLWLDDKDIVVLLTNLLNNAIEACALCKHKKVIKLKIVIEGEQLIISSMNSVSKCPRKEGLLFLTSKGEEIQEHGYGIINIIEVIEKYNGQYAIDYSENDFLFSIIIPQKKS